MGSCPRPSNWDWNPYISISDQVNLCRRSYTDSDIYSRGHLIPNASRNGIVSMQEQTFYVTNSVPQVQDGFNGGIWQRLEAALQKVGEEELIYIVTGVAFNKEGENRAIEYTSARDDDKSVPIPNYFYKVVLKVDTNGAGEVTDATTVGFWFENMSYSGGYDKHTATVDQIEAWTGFDFFVNLPDAIETKAEQNNSWDRFRNW
jgi:endonuclease G